MAHDVFISHSSKDKTFADAVCAALERNGVRCWVAPRDILPGTSWARSIVKAIGGSTVMVLVFSRNAQGSEHVRREVERAAHRRIAIIPLRIEDVLPADELEYFLSSPHWMDAIARPFEQHLGPLAGKVRALLAGDDGGATADAAAAATTTHSSPAAPAPGAVPAARTGPPLPRPVRPKSAGAAAAVLALVVAGTGLTLALRRHGAGDPLAGPRPQQPGPSTGSAAAPAPPAERPTHPPRTSPIADGRTVTNSVGMTLIEIKPGEFMMGSPATEEGREDYETRHRVRMTRPFLMGAREVTRGQWNALSERKPGDNGGDDLPAENVSWDDALAYAERLGRKEGRRYRLPTEAEWEYACRAGTTTPFHTGPTIRTDQANYNGASAYGGGTPGVYRAKTTPVGTFLPNAWGLYDMHGNVGEWCSDWFAPYPPGDAVDPEGPTDPPAAGRGKRAGRVLRGGTWVTEPGRCRSAFRYSDPPDSRDSPSGFRLCLDFDQ